MSILLEVGEVVAAPPTGKRVLRLNDDSNITIVAPDGTESAVEADNAATADAPADATTFTAALDAATTSLKGLLAAADQIKLNTLPTMPTLALTDGNQNITPGATYAQGIMPAGTTTAATTYTLQNVGATPQAQIFDFYIYAQGHDVAICKQDGANLRTVTAGSKVRVSVFFGGTAWAYSQHWPL